MDLLRVFALAGAILWAGCADPATAPQDDVAEGPQNTNGILRGIVQDPDGERLAGARVTVMEPPVRGHTTSTNGFYSFAGLPAGEYEVRAVMDGFQDADYTFPVMAGDQNPPLRIIVLEPTPGA